MWWFMIIVCFSQIWIAFIWHTYEFRIRPHLMAREDIDILIRDILSHDNPEEAAFNKECAAWYRGDTFEQGKWRRVRRALRQAH